MKIIISGATGFIGRKLTSAFLQRDWTVGSISRTDFMDDAKLAAKIDGADVVIHLAGAPIVKRWTKAYRHVIYASRIETTRKMAEAITRSMIKPKLFISTSAVGILQSGSLFTEQNAVLDGGFIGTICQDWEKEARSVTGQTRVVILRLAVVLDANYGALHKMLWAFKWGIGGRIGTGRQLFSWVHREDLINAYLYVIEHESVQGTIHLASPGTVTNREYTRALSKVLKRPALVPIPAVMLKIIYGAAASTLTTGQGAVPEKLLLSGFTFRYERLEDALKDLLS